VFTEHISHPACTHQKQDLHNDNNCASSLGNLTCLMRDRGQGTGFGLWIMEYLVLKHCSMPGTRESPCHVGCPPWLPGESTVPVLVVTIP